MNRSEKLSVVIPVRNDEAGIAAAIESLLNYVSSLARDVQIIAVDDGTSDATAEVLDSLRLAHAQLDVMRLNIARGPRAAAAAGLSMVHGDFVFVQESYEPVDLDALQQLWELRNDEDLVMARVQVFKNEIDAELVQNLTRFAASFEAHFNRGRGENNLGDISASGSRGEGYLNRRPDGQLQMLRRDAMKESAKAINACHLDFERQRHSSVLGKVE